MSEPSSLADSLVSSARRGGGGGRGGGLVRSSGGGGSVSRSSGGKSTSLKTSSGGKSTSLSKSSSSRHQRKSKKGGGDGGFVTGATMVALGTAALAFASKSLARTSAEMNTIKKLYKQDMTVTKLQKLVREGNPLPELVLMKGRLASRGDPVRTATTQIPSFASMIGKINQPENFYRKIFSKQTSESDRALSVPDWMNATARKDLEVEDDFTNRKGYIDDFLVSELFVTRLGCEATLEEEEDEDSGEVKSEATRIPREARFNVHHNRRVSQGLHLEDLNGQSAEIEIPPFDIKTGLSPSLFLSIPDPIQEFSKKVWKVDNSNKPFTHFSKFIFVDQMSEDDYGNIFKNEKQRFDNVALLEDPEKRKASWMNSTDVSHYKNLPEVRPMKLPASLGLLDGLGRLSPNNWYWNGKAFYDNRPGSWSSFPGKEMVDYVEFKRRMEIAAHENARYQMATDGNTASMTRKRDEENCFRVVELGIPSCDVVVVSKPRLEYTNSGEAHIVLGEPDQDQDYNTQRFYFRILKGHTIDNLLKQRTVTKQAYIGLAFMGLFTIKAGHSLTKNKKKVRYTKDTLPSSSSKEVRRS